MSEFETQTRYALSKQVPCIEIEAVFSTNYGELRLSDFESKKVASLVRTLLEQRLEVPEDFFILQQDRYSASCCFAVLFVERPSEGDFVVYCSDQGYWERDFMNYIGFIPSQETSDSWIALQRKANEMLDHTESQVIVIRQIEEPV